MRNKVKILFAVLFALCAVSASFSQSTPASEDRYAESADSRVSEVQPIGASDYFQYSATKAAIYDNGVTLFANALVKYELVAVDYALADKSYFNVKIANAATGDTEYEAPFEIHDEGKVTIEYYSIDKIGNKEQRKQYGITVDNTAPVSRVRADRPIYEVDGKYYVSDSHLFSINSEDASSGVKLIEFSTDGQNYQEYAKVFSIPATTENATLKVRSVDNVLNTTDHFFFLNSTTTATAQEIEGAELVLTVDNIAPQVEIVPDKQPEFRDGRNIVLEDYKYTITATDGESGLAKIFYRLDKAEAWEPYEKPVEFSIYGEHRIEAMAVDNVGNASMPVTLLIFVDLVPPAAETSVD